MKLTHFDIEEFDSPDEVGSGKKMDKSFLKKLDLARGLAETSFIISSGYRTTKHNKSVGGVNGSSHVKGLAADIIAKTSTERFLILSALLTVGFNRIGISGSFIHVDDDKLKSDHVIWVY